MASRDAKKRRSLFRCWSDRTGTARSDFWADTRRMNVALTRARRKLLVIGDSATIGGHPFYQRWLEYCEAFGSYRTVWEED